MSEGALDMRVYIGGFTQAVTDAEVRGRFNPFGEVRSVELPQATDSGGCRGFGYVNISITAAQWHRCMSLYTGAKWKGGKMRVEEAKEDFTARLKREWAEAREPPVVIEDKEERLTMRKKKMYASSSTDGIEVEDMAVVTDKNFSRYPGWIKGRYGRPVLKYSIVRPSGKMLNYDPAKHKLAFERLAASDVEPKLSSDLQWEYDQEAARGDFEAASQMPQSALDAIEKAQKLCSKRQRLEEEAQRVQKKLRLQNGADMPDDQQEDHGFTTTSSTKEEAKQSSYIDRSGVVDFDEGPADSTIDAALDLAPFEDAEDIALLVSSRNAVPVPELQAKLASGAFDSDSEYETEIGAKKHASAALSVESQDISTEEMAELARERERMAAIMRQLLAQEPSSVVSNVASSAPVDGSEKTRSGQSTRGSRGSGNKGNKSDKASSNSSSDSNSDSDSSSSSGSEESGSGSAGGSDQGSDQGSGDESSSSESDSDSESESEPDSDSESEGDNNGDGAMDVDEPSRSALKDLFCSTQQPNAQASGGGSGLFGAPSSAFKFTEALGLEEDEPSAMAREDDDYEAPVTGGSRLTGPAERNLNANRLPAFFPDVDSPMFKRPEPVFQRQKTEEELEADLERISKEMTKEYKAQHRSTVRKTQKLADRRAPRQPN
ncbi:hypothetical protein GGI04_002141 [Coemansia thaxteri]|nr:hypothetical protein GGI04_002141 [Coemansia thaxteri]KAJ2470781.1 hypothetical protein GGI02_002702 [Coemansia sp. RSA 2322]KAJ2487120.1 hypothetical protein EV174_000732 [Coemansia sp. RSA 2320]